MGTQALSRQLLRTLFAAGLFLSTAKAAEVLPLNNDPGPTPGDLFQGAVIDVAQSTPAKSGFDLRDIFGGQFSAVEVGRTVLADNQGSAVQSVYFHTAAPVTLSGYQLYLGDDNAAGRGASQVEFAMTDASFGSNTVLSTVNPASPYPSAIGANSIRHIMVSDSFAPVTGQYFVLRFTPATPNAGVRVIEFDGVGTSGVLAATNVDFSTAGFTGAATAQTPVRGFTYGYYTGTNSTTGAFSTAGMTGAGFAWSGDQGFGTPGQDYRSLHPGTGATRSAVVRRYTVGAGGESAYSGEVRIVGRFFDIDQGAVDAFVAVDLDGDAGPGTRDLIVPATAVNGAAATVSFDFNVTVTPNATIDFGALAGASGDFDAIGFYASIVTAETAVPTQVVANNYNSVLASTTSSTDLRSAAAAMVTDGVVSSTDAGSFDTAPGTGSPYQFAGLLYLENAGSGKATRFDSVRIDVTTGGDFSDTPRLYLLRHNSDPNTSNPAADDRYARLPLVPVRTLNTAGEPSYSFDLSTLSEAESTGYGFAVVGTGKGANFTIAVSEISAVATRVNDTAVIAVEPFLIEHGGKSYGLTTRRGNWEELHASAVAAGGNLVTINDVAEQSWLTEQFSGEELFIGLKQDAPTVSEPGIGWRWRTGEVLGDAGVFVNWLSGEPNNFGVGGEAYATLNYPGFAADKWVDVPFAHRPELSGLRGIIELPTGGAGVNNFYITALSARANIFDAGLASATQGGVLPSSLDLTIAGGNVIVFPQIVGLFNTGVDASGPDGAHTAGRSSNLTGVGGISGYLNGNNTPALVGVFLGATQPATQPARLDFSASALGEDFETLAPELGQVFFIGDGYTTAGVQQQFTIPPGATRLFLGYPDGNNGTLYHGTPLGYSDNSGTMNIRASVLPSATPFIASANFPAAGGQLTANGGTGPYSFEVIGGSLPPHLSLSALGNVTSSGQPRVNGSYAFTVRVTDSTNATADKQFTVIVADPVDVPSGIVAWWPGDNGVNEIIGGLHGSFRNVAFDTLSLQNGSAYRAGTVGRGFAFDGVNDFIEVADHDSLDITGDLTIEAWVKATATSGERTIVSKRDGSNANVTYVLFARGGELRFASRAGGGAFADIGSGANLPTGFAHVAATISGTSLKFFINGAEVATSNISARPATSGPLTIGGTVTDTFPASSPDGPWSGVIDELSLYNRALSAGEISKIYAAGAGGKKRADAAREFSATQNPAGVWSYLELPSSASLASYDKDGAVLMTTNGVTHSGRVDFWNTSAAVGRNNSQDFIVIPSGGSQYDYNVAELSWGPGSGSQMPVLRWTAPIGGRYAVSANFINTDTTPSSTDVFIRHGSAAIFDSFVTPYRADGVSHTSTITAAAGDTVDFILGTRGNWTYDSAALAASVVFLSTPLELAADFPEQPADPQTPWQPLTATGGTGPYTFAVTNGSLPAALVLAQNGSISGTLAATPGRTTFTVTATDAVGASASKEYTVVVAQEFALPSGATAWFPGELHPHDVVGGALGVTSGFPASGPYGVGKSGTGFVFDGVDDALTVSNNTALNALPLTIEAWIKPELRSGNAADFWPTNIISGDRAQFGGHGIGANVFADGSHLWIEVQHTSPAQAFRRVPGDHFRAGEWAHIALVLTSGNAKTYVNGSLVDDFDFSQGAMDADPFFRIGRHNEDAGYPVGQRFFKGAIDEVTTYNRALSAAEILNIVNTDWIGKNRDDAARDFFSQTNVAGQLWQYGQMGTGLAPDGTTFARYETVGSENALRFWRNGSAPDPNVIKNRGDVPYLHWAPGQLSVHPGPGAERIFSAVRWTAPAPGRYAFFSEYSRLNTQVGTASIHLFKGENSFGSKTITDTQRKDTIFGTSFVQAGDTVDFVVGSRDDFGFDAVGITPSVVKLSAGPEFTTTTFPAALDGALSVDGALVVTGDGPFTFAVTSGTLPPGLTLRTDGVVKGTFTQNGAFAFTVTVTDGNGLSVARAFNVAVSNVPPPPPFKPADSIRLKAASKNGIVRQDAVFTFTAVQTGDVFAAGLRLRIEWTTTPSDAASWQELEDGTMDRKKPGDTQWTLKTQRVPAGPEIYFRVVTRADAYSPGIGQTIGPVNIEATPVIEVTLQATTDEDPEFDRPDSQTGRIVRPEEKINYFLTVKNIGSAPAAELVYGLKLPKFTQYENVLRSEGTFETLPKGANERKTTSVQWRLAGLAAGAQARSSMFVDVKREAKNGTIINANGAYVTYKGKVAPAEVDDRVVETLVTPPVSVKLEVLSPTAVRGGSITFKMTARNDASYDARETKAYFRLPVGARLYYVGKRPQGDTNFTDFSDAGTSDPEDSQNPKVNPYRFGAPQVLKWDIGTIPGTDNAPNSTARTREMLFVLQVRNDVSPTTLVNGVYETTALSCFGWNLFFTPPGGGSVPVFAQGGPEVRVLIDGANVFDPPVIALHKTSEADTIFRNQTIPNDQTFAGNVTGVIQGNFITYRLNYRNDGSPTSAGAEHCYLFDRIAPGTVFKGFVKVSRTGNPADEQEIPFNAYRFYDKSGKLISGEPYFDSNSNGKWDQGEPYTDFDGNKKFTARKDISDAVSLRFDIGRLQPGTQGYVSYRCVATAKAGTFIKSEGYGLASDSLNLPITGSPRATYARVSTGLTFDVLQSQNRTKASPFDNPARPQDSDIETTVVVHNTGDLRSTETTIPLVLPEGLVVQQTVLLDHAGNVIPGALPVLKGRTLTWTTNIPAGERRTARVVTRVVPTAQLPKNLQKLDSVFLFSKAEVTGKFNPTSAQRFRLSTRERALTNTAATVTGTGTGNDTTVLLEGPNRAEVWALKSVLISQESRKNLNYLFVVGNSGNIDARNVEAGFFIPPGTNFIDASPAGWERKGEVIRWKLGTLAAHAAQGLAVTVNIAHLDSGMVKDNSFVVTSDNSPEVVPYATRTTVRERPSENLAWTALTNAVAVIGINLKGDASTALRSGLSSLNETSRTHAVRGADNFWLSNGVGVIPNGGGKVVLIGRTGLFNGGTTIVSAEGTSIIFGTGSAITGPVGIDNGATVSGTYSGAQITALVEQAKTRSDKNAPNIFAGGNGKLVYDGGNQLINNDTGAVIGLIAPKIGTQLVAAGGLNLVAAGGGNIVAAGGMNLVAAGGGNLVAAGGLNLVAAGGGNITATIGGNLVAAGGLNLVAAGGGNVLSHNGSTLVAAGGLNNSQGLLAARGGTLVGNDGASLVGNDGASLIGNDGSTLIGNDGSTLIGNDGSTLIGNDGSTMITAGAGN